MRKMQSSLTISAILGLLLLGSLSFSILADGTETLGPPLGLTVASGTGIVAAGTGMAIQPGTININVPAGATVRQVLLYWEGHSVAPDPGDDSISINGNPVTGTLIGGPTTFFFSGGEVQSSSFRADITALSLIAAGPNSLTVSDMAFSFANNGAGVLVIFDDGSASASIQIRDGNDLAFFRFASPLDTTVPQTFIFPPATADRTATLSMFFGSVEENRPNSIEVTINGVTTPFDNLLGSNNGPDWDTLNLSINIPAGSAMLTVQALSTPSEDPLGASLGWIGAALSVPPPVVEDEGCSPGYWKNHKNSWGPTGYSPGQKVGSVFNAGSFPSLASKTLHQALGFGGGPGTEGAAKILLRAAVAALLNSAHPDVDYPRITAEVIADVNAALASNNRNTMLQLAAKLDEDNNLGCPLN